MNLGAEDKKKVRWLIGLMVVAAVALYINVFSDSTSSPPPKSVVSERESAGEVPPAVSGPASRAPSASAPRSQSGRAAKGDEFRPSLRPKRPEDQFDPFTIDPTLRLDLLAKVQGVQPEGGARNLFQFGAAPPPELKGPEPKIAVAAKIMDYPRPDPPPVPKAGPPPPPPDPPIDVKYYGLATKQIDGKKTAFFLDGEAIILAPEGGLVKKKYKVVRISATSVLMENIDSKKQQSLPLAEDAGANMSD